MKLILLSPHRDDAAFSCGLLLSICRDANVAVEVVNIFTHSDYAPFAEPSTADVISRLREAEDAAMRSLLGSSLSFLDLGLDDAPLRLHIPAEQTLRDPIDRPAYVREVESLKKIFRPVLMGADCVLVPSAMGGHIDHLIARDAAIGCVPPDRLAFYEDLPYASRLDEARREKILEGFAHVQPVLVSRANGPEVKRRLASCYGSQVDGSTIDEMVAYAKKRDGGELLHAATTARMFLLQIIALARRELPSNER